MPATQQSAATAASEPGNEDSNEMVTRSARDIMLENLGNRQEEIRNTGIEEGLAADPGAAAMQARIETAQAANRAEAEEEGLLEPIQPELTDEQVESGVATIEQMHEEVVVEEVDPLAGFIQEVDGQPKIALTINGETMYMDVEDARRKLQIRTAAEIELQDARNFKKQLDTRDEQLSAGEQALNARIATAAPVEQVQTESPIAPAPAMSEEEIQSEAIAIFKTAFSGTEEEAAAKLAKLLTKVQTPVAMPQALVDVAAITRNAAHAAVGAVDARDQKKDLVTGINTFRDEYPDIVGDPVLYKMADGMTDDVVAENPTWSKSRVMLEAGKRTRKWVENLKGAPATDEEVDADAATEESVIPEPALSPTHDRQVVKRELVRMPHAAAGAVNQSEVEVDERPQSATEALNELRASRGQPV